MTAGTLVTEAVDLFVLVCPVHRAVGRDMFSFSKRIDALTSKFTGSWLGECHIRAEHQHDARECCFHRLHLWKLKCAATQLGPLADDDSTDADCTEATVISTPGWLS